MRLLRACPVSTARRGKVAGSRIDAERAVGRRGALRTAPGSGAVARRLKSAERAWHAETRRLTAAAMQSAPSDADSGAARDERRTPSQGRRGALRVARGSGAAVRRPKRAGRARHAEARQPAATGTQNALSDAAAHAPEWGTGRKRARHAEARRPAAAASRRRGG